MDNLIIENLACAEVNRVIFQKPFRLVSEIKSNDKSPSFDGEILIYNSSDLSKRTLEGAVKVQVKGTTTLKKIKKRKIPYSVSKDDLEVYKRFAEGVVYFVVTINSKTSKSQIFYNALSPLDIERYLKEIKSKGTDSISIQFKTLLDNQLESVCRLHMNNVRRQPAYYIDGSKRREFKEYKIEYNITDGYEGFDFFENIGYVYGVEGNLEFPVEAIIPDNVNIGGTNYFEIDGNQVGITYKIKDTPKEMIIWFEDNLEISFIKRNKVAKLDINKFTSINTYLTSLWILKYIVCENKLPIDIYDIEMTLIEKGNYQNIDEEINQYLKLLEVCESIGISGDYCFREDENLKELFHIITEIFIEKKYHLIKNESETNDFPVIKLSLTDHIKLFLYKDKKTNLYNNLFDEAFFNRYQVYIPKKDGAFNPNTDEYYKVSYYSMYPVNEIIDFVNFNFEIYKKSFDVERHEKSLDNNNNLVLELINLFDKTQRSELLELGIYLLDGLIKTHEENDIYRLNSLQIKKRINENLTPEDEEYLYSIIESTADKQIKLVANVILGLKIPSERIFESLEVDKKSEVEKWPIYNLLLKLKSE